MIFKNKKYQKHFIAIFALFIYMSMVFAFTVSQVMQKGQQWKQSLSSNVTVELPIGADLQSSIKLIRAIEEVKVVDAMEDSQKEEILSKWIDGVDFSKMPISDVIEVTVSSGADIESLQDEIESKLKDSKVYSNVDWGRDVLDMTNAIFYMCIFLFCLILVVSLVLINFMIKSLLNSYAKEIDILHLNGANDVFISAMLQKNIFVQALKSSLLGVLLAHITWYVLSMFFNINYELRISSFINASLIVLLVSIISSIFVKFNVEKELRL